MDKKQLHLKLIYESVMIILALISVILVFASMFSIISLNVQPYISIERFILAVFWVDYITRLIKSENKREFFRNNFFDLLAILPLSNSFAIFRLIRIIKFAQVAQLYKVAKLVKVLEWILNANKNLNKFLITNGFIYLLYCTILLIITSALLMSYAEGISFSDATWWALVTCTTVGYGDVVPVTSLGRFVAVILMIFGVGFLGMLTSTITTFIASRAKERKNKLEAEMGLKKEHVSSDYIELVNIINDLNDNQQAKLLAFAKSLRK